MTRITVVFYSTYGTNHAIADAAAEAARAAGAEVRLVRIPETAPAEVVAGQDGWKAEADRAAAIPVVTPEDLEWAHGIFLASPTRYGGMASQTRAWLDTLASRQSNDPQGASEASSPGSPRAEQAEETGQDFLEQ